MKRLKVMFMMVMLFASFEILFAQNEAILKLDTLGHTSLIKDIIVTDDGELISASEDKTISYKKMFQLFSLQKIMLKFRRTNNYNFPLL